MTGLTYEDLFEGLPDGWTMLVDAEPCGTWRWGYLQRYVVRRESDGACFSATVECVSGDNGINEGVWEWEQEPDFDQVYPVERTVIEYVMKKPSEEEA